MTDMMGLEIEKGVPLPSLKRTSKWRTFADRMQLGDSVLVSRASEIIGLSHAIRESGCKAVTFKVGDGSWRVWKLLRRKGGRPRKNGGK